MVTALIIILVYLILFSIIFLEKNKIKSLIEKNSTLDKKLKTLQGEFEIEKKHNKELSKKLSEINSMSIDNVLHQLQNNKSN